MLAINYLIILFTKEQKVTTMKVNKCRIYVDDKRIYKNASVEESRIQVVIF